MSAAVTDGEDGAAVWQLHAIETVEFGVYKQG